MQAIIKRYLHSGEPCVTYGRDGALWVECDVTHPASRVGQKVHLRIEPDMITPMLLELRHAAVAQRSTPESG